MSHKCYSHPKKTTFRKPPDAPESNLCCKKIHKIPPLLVLQCRAGLQAAGGQATAPDEETLPHGQPTMPRSALPQRGLHIHAEAQDQDRVQKARSLETLVPLNKTWIQPIFFFPLGALIPLLFAEMDEGVFGGSNQHVRMDNDRAPAHFGGVSDVETAH